MTSTSATSSGAPRVPWSDAHPVSFTYLSFARHPFGFWQARDCRIVTDPRTGNETDLPPPTPRCETYCTNFEGTFLCSCDDGWTVDDGGYECRDLDECTHAAPASKSSRKQQLFVKFGRC